MGLISEIPVIIGKGDQKLYRLIFTILIPLTIFVVMQEYNQKVLQRCRTKECFRYRNERETDKGHGLKESLLSDLVQLKKEI
jgi:hypothetical protein